MGDTSLSMPDVQQSVRRRNVQNVRIYIFIDNCKVTMWWEEGSFSARLEPDVRVIDKSIIPYSQTTEYELALMCNEDIRRSMQQEHMRKEFYKAKRAGRLHEIKNL